MDEASIDHYIVLGLPSGEKSWKISHKDIKKAYRLKALELHPDKRTNDPNAVSLFQNLQISYQILKDDITRKAFDDDLMIRLKQQQQQQGSSHKRTMNNDFDFTFEPSNTWVDSLSETIAQLRRDRMADIQESERRKMAEIEREEEEERNRSEMMSRLSKLKRRRTMMSFFDERDRAAAADDDDDEEEESIHTEDFSSIPATYSSVGCNC